MCKGIKFLKFSLLYCYEGGGVIWAGRKGRQYGGGRSYWVQSSGVSGFEYLLLCRWEGGGTYWAQQRGGNTEGGGSSWAAREGEAV